MSSHASETVFFTKRTSKTTPKNAPEIGSKLLQHGAEKDPDEPQALQNVVERAHSQPKQAKGTYRDDTSTPKGRQRLQKGSERNPKASKKTQKIVKKRTKN